MRNQEKRSGFANQPHATQRGAALVSALIIMALLSAVAMTVLAVVSHESRIAGSDLQRTQTFYATAAGCEKMTNDFSALFTRTSRPTQAQLNDIAADYPIELVNEGFSFMKADGSTNQSLVPDPGAPTGLVTIPHGPFSGLLASVTPYVLDCTGRQIKTGAEVRLQRKMNNYLIPIFQFGMFSNKDIELHPGPAFAFNGRVHANGNIYVNGNVTFLSRVTTANEFVYDVLRNGSVRAGASVSMRVGAITVPVTMGSMVDGPRVPSALPGQRGYFPGSPNGSISSTWNATSVAPAQAGFPNRFGGQLLTRSTGGAQLLLPMQIEGAQTREVVKRRMPNDSEILSGSRYHSKASVRILIDTEGVGDAAGIPAGQGVNLSSFDPMPLPNLAINAAPTANGGGRALWRILDNNTAPANSYNETATSYVLQAQPSPSPARQADSVRSPRAPVARALTGATNANPIVITSNGHGYSNGDVVLISGVAGNLNANGEYTIGSVTANTFALTGRAGSGNCTAPCNTGTVYKLIKSANNAVIPYGAGLSGRILIQVIDAYGVERDVTREVLSMGITEGEPNSIVMLQRPLWGAFVQGSRDAAGGNNHLAFILNNGFMGADGEILVDSTRPTLNAAFGYMGNIADDTPSGQPRRSDVPPSNAMTSLMSGTPGPNWPSWNAIVPINVYNVREGHLRVSLGQNAVYERGITNVVQINMRNLARWLDGIYDNNLFQGTNAISANIAKPDGFTVYVSDRRGDKVRPFVDPTGANINATNGMVDNEDIYGPNNYLDPGEDVQETGALVKDTTELPDPAQLAGAYGTNRVRRAIAVAAWTNPSAFYRTSVRLFNGEDMLLSGTAGKLSNTMGITVATENMTYIWGNYNTTGISGAPPLGVACLNDPAAACRYNGDQIPASIVGDAFFPLSKTWFDGLSAMYPDSFVTRPADNGLPGVTNETSVRAAIIAGNNTSALAGDPDADNGQDSRLSGGMHNFPRFLEDWLNPNRRWNYVGSFIPLYHSTQAMGQWWYITGGVSVYGAPIRNWAFDTTFTNPNRLPPSTPLFQNIEPTGFKQVL